MPSPSPSRKNLALVAICLSALMLGLEITSIPAILPLLEGAVPADFRQLQWIMNAYTLAMSTVLMAMGALGDRFGRKRVFIAGTLVFGLASLACALAPSALALIGARFLQGLAAAAMLACQIALLSRQFPSGAERGRAFGYWGIVFGAGLGFGPLVGGALATLASWNWVFLIHVGLAAVTVACALGGLEESANPAAQPLDLAGMLTLSLAVFGGVYLIIQGPATAAVGWLGWGLSLGCLLLFVVIERRQAQPMFDFAVLRVRRFSGALLGASGMNFSFWPFVVYLPLYLQAVLGLDALATGGMVLAYTLPTVLVPPLAERLLLRHGPGLVIPLGLGLIGLGFALLSLAVSLGADQVPALVPGCLLAGIGVGLTNTPVTNTATAALPVERSGMASGLDMSTRIIALALNIALMGAILLGGVAAHLDTAATTLDGSGLESLAEAIAAGNLGVAQAQGVDLSLARAALGQGVGWVTSYAAACACGFALLSLRLLRPARSGRCQCLAKGGEP
ncbi:MFS transporter [Pseudomonas oryzihabitans]|uniref:MFS transporter n=1 Tax=Pseudomonas oryzihabitans TaxID=47885 RepID=UPI0028944125|nr:MFS transporter [Pseudomonas oryzihabitans]MDT3719688.1 MFS transporter [Pseudomonas oryzihabitans]